MIKAILLSGLILGMSVLFEGSVYASTVNINQADAPTLASELHGIGLKKAQAIIDYRKLNGPFSSLDELKSVKGISGKTIEKNRKKMTF